jgi:hypothetical protein
MNRANHPRHSILALIAVVMTTSSAARWIGRKASESPLAAARANASPGWVTAPLSLGHHLPALPWRLVGTIQIQLLSRHPIPFAG